MSLPLSTAQIDILYSQLKPAGGTFDGLNVRSNIYFPTSQWSANQYLLSSEINMYKVKIESNVYISDSLVTRDSLIVGNSLTWSKRLNLQTGTTVDYESIIPTDRNFKAFINGNVFVSDDIMCNGIIPKKKNIVVNNANISSNISLTTDYYQGQIVLGNLHNFNQSNIITLKNNNVKSKFNTKEYDKKCINSACSADGLFIVIINNPGVIDISTDGGQTWSYKGFNNNWKHCACSRSLNSFGNYYIAVSDEIGALYTSFNNGNLFIKQVNLGFKKWSSIAFSNDAHRIFATVTDEYLYTGSFITNTNLLKTNSNALKWSSAKCSSDGKHIIASETNGNIFFSNNFGVEFIKKIDNTTYDWNSINISNDGLKVIASEFGGNIWISNNSGNTFNKQLNTNMTNKNWAFLNQSINGNIIITADKTGNILISNNSGETFQEITGYVLPNSEWQLCATSTNCQYISISNKKTNTTKSNLFYSNNIGLQFTEIINTGLAENEFLQILISENGRYTYLLGKQIFTTSQGAQYNKIYIYDNNLKTLVNTTITNYNLIIKKMLLSSLNDVLYLIPEKGYIIKTINNLNNTYTTVLNNLDYQEYNLSECSIDGSKLLITNRLGNVFTSNDYGQNWNTHYNININTWTSGSIFGNQIILSSNTNNAGNVFLSTPNIFNSIDYNWNNNQITGKRKWNNVICSNNSSKVLASVDGGKLYSSFDFGLNWTHYNINSVSVHNTSDRIIATEENGLMFKINRNSNNSINIDIINGTLQRNYKDTFYNGTLILATVLGSGIHVSKNDGTSWNVYSNLLYQNRWDKIAFSTSSNIYITSKPGKIFQFNNTLNTLNLLNNSLDKNWQDITCSTDGKTVIAAVYGGSVYNSIDFGNNWNTINTKWTGVVCDSSGLNITGIVTNGYIYNSLDGGKFWNTYKTDKFYNWANIAADISGRVIITTEKIGNIYVSKDNGLFWYSNTDLGIKNWNGLCCSSNGINILSYEKTGTVGNIWYSNNQGSNWINYSTPNFIINNLSCDSDMKNILGTEMNGNILTSINNGQNWTIRTNTPKNWSSCSTNSTGQYMICSVKDEFIYISNNYGQTWNIRLNDIGRNWTSVSVNNGGNYMIATSSGNINTSIDTGYIFISSDFGNSWSYANWESVSCNLEGDNIIAAIKNGYLYRSIDSGANWNPIVSADLYNWSCVCHSKKKYNNVDYIIAATVNNGYIYISYNSGVTWNSVNSVRYWVNIKMSENGQYIIAAETNGYLHYSKDSGSNWNIITQNGVKKWTGLDISFDGKIIYATVYDEKIYSSIDFGETWTNNSWSQSIISYDALTNISIVYGGYIYKSVFVNNNWKTQIISSFDGLNINKNRNWKYICGVSDLSTMFAIEYNGYIWKSVNFGESWTSIKAIGVDNWSSIACNSKTTGNIVVGLTLEEGGIYISIDSGNTWLYKLNDISRKWKNITINNDGSIITAVATNDYIYISNNSGNTWSIGNKWKSISTNKTNGTHAISLVENGYLYLSTNSGNDWVLGNTQNVNSISRNWRSSYISDDGSRMSAVVYGGNIWQSIDNGNTWSDNNITQNWTFIIGYNNGINQIAGSYNGNIYNFNNNQWTEISSGQGLSNKKWIDGCADVNGNNIFVMIEDGQIYKSTNKFNFNISDLTLTANNWTSISIGGSYVVATNNTNIYSSINYGNTFSLNTAINGVHKWTGTDISSNGLYQYYVEDNGYLWSSNNYGSSINIVKGSDLTKKLNYSSISCTNDGSKFYGTIYNNNDYQLFNSVDFGNIITYKFTNGIRKWNNITISNIGNIMYVAENDGLLYKSTSQGALWNVITGSTNKWSSLSTNNNGTILLASADKAGIFQYRDDTLTRITGTTDKEWKSVSLSSNIVNSNILFSAVSAGTGDNSSYFFSNTNRITLVENPNKKWTDITCSNIGSNILASVYGEHIYKSDDFGSQFTLINTSPRVNWQSIALSKNSNKFIGVAFSNLVYTSNDFGLTYTNNVSNNTWKSVDISADGSLPYIVNTSGDLYRRITGVFAKTAVLPRREWKTCDISEDGSFIVAMIDNETLDDQIYTSSNYNFTFLPKFNDKNRKWTSISSNATSSLLIACEEYGYVYISKDLGLSWTPRHFISSWIKVEINLNNNNMFAIEKNGYFWISRNNGLNWSIYIDINKNWITFDARYRVSTVSNYNDTTHLYGFTSNDSNFLYDNNKSWKAITLSTNEAYAINNITEIYYSYNSFLSWKNNTNLFMPGTLINENYYRIITNANNSKLIVQSDKNIYMCYNNASNIYNLDSSLKLSTLSTNHDLTKFIGTSFGRGVYIGSLNTDETLIWTKKNVSLSGEFTSIVYYPNSTKIIAVLIKTSVSKYTLYITTNQGSDWIIACEINSSYLSNMSLNTDLGTSDLFIIYMISPSDNILYKYQYYIKQNSRLLLFNQLTSSSIGGTSSILGVSSFGSAGEFICTATTLLVGSFVKISGALGGTGSITGYASPTTYKVSAINTGIINVQITGTAGQFSCTATTLAVGNLVTISGALGGTGTITGYTSPTTYKVSAITGSGSSITGFTLTTTSDVAIVTTVGTLTGYSIGRSILGISTNGTSGQFTCFDTTLSIGNLLTISGTLGGTGSITGYTSSTTYKVSAINTGIIGVSTAGTAGQFRCFDTNLSVGNLVTISGSLGGTGTITGYTSPTTYKVSAINTGIIDVQITGTAGQFSCTATTLVVGDQVTISGTLGGTGTITGYTSPTTYKVLAIIGQGSLVTGFTLTTTSDVAIVTTVGTLTGYSIGRSILGLSTNGVAGQFTCFDTTLSVGNLVTISGTLTGTGSITGYTSSTTYKVSAINTGIIGVSTAGTAGQFTCFDTTLSVGNLVTISGTLGGTGSITGYASPTTYKVSAVNTGIIDVQITGTAGQFTCTSTTLAVGNLVTISGTLGGTGTITGYTSPTTYKVSAIIGSGSLVTGFTLTTTSDVAIVTTAGTLSGYSIGRAISGVATAGTAGQFTCTATTLSVGNLVTISGTLGGTGTIAGYTSSTTYKVSAITGQGSSVTGFTLTTTSDAAIVTTAGTLTGLLLISGSSVTGFTLTTTSDAAIVTTIGTLTGYSIGRTISSVATAGTAGQFTCTATTLAVGNLVTISGTLGGTGTITGYSSSTTYKVSAITGSGSSVTGFTLITTSGAAIVTTAGTLTGLLLISGSSVTGLTLITTSDVAIVTTAGTLTGLLSISGSSVSGFTLTTTLDAAIVTTIGTLNGYSIGRAISGVSTAGTAGQFTCTATTLSVGNLVTISGTLTGTGIITGYASSTTYRVSAITGLGSSVTGFTLRTISGAAIVTTAGTLTGLLLISGSSVTGFTLTTTADDAIVTTAGTLTGLLSISGPSITGFTLKTTSDTAIVTTAGTLTGLILTIIIPNNQWYDLTVTNYDVNNDIYNVFWGIPNVASNKKIYNFRADTNTVLEVSLTLDANDTKLKSLYFDSVLGYLFVASEKNIYWTGSSNYTTFTKCQNLVLTNDNFVSIYFTEKDKCLYAITDNGTVYRSLNSYETGASWTRYKIYESGIKKIISSLYSDIVVVLTESTIYISNSYGAYFVPYLREYPHQWQNLLITNDLLPQIFVIGKNENIYYGTTDNTYENSLISATIGGYTNSSIQPKITVKSIINSEIEFQISDFVPTVNDTTKSSLIINYSIS